MLFRQLAEWHDWPPQVVADWTYYQCRMMVAPEEELTGIRKGQSADDMRRIQATPRKVRKMLARFGLGGNK